MRVFSSSPQTFSQRQNIFVRVFSWTWISSPMTGSHSGIRSRSGTKSKPSARSSAWPARKRRFSENCGPISCRPTGRPSERPHGIERPGRPAMFGGIVSTSERYIASGFSAFSPSLKATVGDVGLTRRSKSLERGGVLLRDHRAHLLRLAVVRVVVAGRERVRAEHDAALRLGAEALPARARVERGEVAVACGAVAVADAVVAGEVRARLGRRDEVVARRGRSRPSAAGVVSPTSAPRLSASAIAVCDRLARRRARCPRPRSAPSGCRCGCP